MEMFEQDVTIKEKVVRALLNSQRFMSAAELSDITGYRPSVVSTSLADAVREARFDIKTCLMPKQPGRLGPRMVNYFRCDGIGPFTRRKAPVFKAKDEPLVRESDGDVSHLVQQHDPLWHFAICRPAGARM